jgi:hypothetical protein
MYTAAGIQWKLSWQAVGVAFVASSRVHRKYSRL